VSFTADELDCLRHELCECEEHNSSGAYSLVTNKCLNCQFIDEIEQLTDALEQTQTKIRKLVESRTAWRERYVERSDRVIKLEAVLQRIADSGIENNSAWAWIGGQAKQILQSIEHTCKKPS